MRTRVKQSTRKQRTGTGQFRGGDRPSGTEARLPGGKDSGTKEKPENCFKSLTLNEKLQRAPPRAEGEHSSGGERQADCLGQGSAGLGSRGAWSPAPWPGPPPTAE